MDARPDGGGRRPDRTSNNNAPGRNIALVGNPNCGKTTVFNALTGLRQRVGNYPGVTVERKEGTVVALPGTDLGSVNLIDLPGTYSLTPHSPDERIARDVLLGYEPNVPRPDLIVNVVDASNLERNLFLTSQLLELGIPVVVALTMTDTARKQGVTVQMDALARDLGVPVIPVVASRRVGLDDLRAAFFVLPGQPAKPSTLTRLTMPRVVEQAAQTIAALLHCEHQLPLSQAYAEAMLLLNLPPEGNKNTHEPFARWSPKVREAVGEEWERLTAGGIDVAPAIAEARYAWADDVVRHTLRREPVARESISDRIDRVVLHKVWGYAIFLGLMYAIFQAMFTWAAIPQDWIRGGVDTVGGFTEAHLPAGDLRDLLVRGVIAGVGNSLVFLPQILLLFLFISLLEDTGYLARGAFLMDRLMSRVGLHGKSFIPLLSSYACAIPGIMATRTIDSSRARILTILIAPLMSCSARLPVYALMIGTFIPHTRVWGIFSLPALTLLSMYALGTGAAFGVAALFNRTLLRSEAPTFLLEMPPYRLPSLRSVVLQMWERAWLFLRRAATVILAITVVLWFLCSYPKLPTATTATKTPTASALTGTSSGEVRGEQLRHSFAGRIGQAIEPVIAPLGFDWKMGIGLISSFAAREVFVSAMGTIYNLDEGASKDDEKFTVSLGEKLKADVDPRTGRHSFTPLVAIALMVYYVLAMQCMSTVAVVRRETNGWRWPLFQIAYMTALAWGVTFIVYQVGRLLGYG